MEINLKENKMEISLREYVIQIGKALDENFYPELNGDGNPKEPEIIQKKVNKLLIEKVPDYYQRNIAPEMAAEFLAHELKLIRREPYQIN